MMQLPLNPALRAQGTTAQTVADSSNPRAERTGEFIGQAGMLIIAIGVGMWIMQRRQKKEAARASKPPKR